MSTRAGGLLVACGVRTQQGAPRTFCAEDSAANLLLRWGVFPGPGVCRPTEDPAFEGSCVSKPAAASSWLLGGPKRSTLPSVTVDAAGVRGFAVCMGNVTRV